MNTDYFKPLEAVGASDLNGSTNNDRTNYFEKSCLRMLLNARSFWKPIGWAICSKR